MRVSVRRIQEIVTAHYGLPAVAMTGRDRCYAQPRQEAIYLAGKLTDLSLTSIGRLFGDKDHTTIIHANRQIEKRIAEDRNLAARIERFAARAAQSTPIVSSGWPQNEIEILTAIYPKRGSKAVARLLPHRSLQAIWARARKLNIRFEKISHPLVNFPRECKQCAKPLHYSMSAKYLHREPTGLCRGCCNRRPRTEEQIKRASEATKRAYQDNPEYREKQTAAVRAAMARLSDEERARRRERGRLCGLRNKGNQARPAGSEGRRLASIKAAATLRRNREAAQRAERQRPKTFEEQLQAVLEGRATIYTIPTAANSEPEFTLGGVSSGWAA
jgi:hypothetical protein